MPLPKDPEKLAEWRHKQSEAHKGQNVSPERRVQLSEEMRKRREDPAYMQRLMDGIASREMTPAYHQKLSDAGKQHIAQLNEARVNAAAANRGRRHSESERTKRAASLRGNTNGRHLSAASREKRSLQLKSKSLRKKGSVTSQEHRKRLSQVLRGNIALKNAMVAYWARLSDQERTQRITRALDARSFSNAPSSIETATATALAALDIANIPQYHIGRYIADFFVPELNLVIECAGCYWHSCPTCGIEDRKDRRERDAKRTAVLLAKGYRVAMLWEHSLNRDIAQTLNAMLASIVTVPFFEST